MNTISQNEINTIKKKEGLTLYRKGEVGKHLYILTKGKVLLVDEQEKFIPANVVCPGEFLGQEILFRQKNDEDLKGEYRFYAFTLEDIEFVKIPVEDINVVMDKLPDWVNLIMGTLSKRLNHSVESLKDHKILPNYAFRDHEIDHNRLNDIYRQLKV
ncbi:Crp/Fnr family transcriptional regulator [bacterium]|nr:Crp/Fnr family transcriptional regulator [bacterium]